MIYRKFIFTSAVMPHSIYNLQMHYTEFEKQVQSLFQVKIKGDYISKLFQTVQAKISHLQTQVQTLQSQEYQKAAEERALYHLKPHIKQEMYTCLTPISDRMETINQKVCEFHRGQQNFNTLLEQELKKVECRFWQTYEQERVSMNSELEQFGLMSNALEKTLNGHIQETNSREEKFECDIQSIWDAIKSKQSQTKKKPEHKHSLFYKLNSNKQNPQKQQMTYSSFRKVSNMEGLIESRKPLQKQVLGESRRQSKALEYVSLLLKVENLEKKIDESVSKSTLPLRNHQDGSNDSYQSFQRNEQAGQKVTIQRKRAKPSNSLSRLNRSSINSKSENESQISQNQCPNELAKVNDKLTELKFKYTLLQQNHQIMLNKISRVTQMQSNLHSKMNEIQKMRIDLSTINEINMRFRKIQTSYQEQDYKYVLSESYAKDAKAVKEGVKDIEAKLNKMAHRDEVRQALVFIQTKIKEMALVLTDKFESQKEGAINKVKEVKCLTCDKECEDQAAQVRRSLNTAQNMRRGKLGNQLSRLKRKPRQSQKKIRTEGNQHF